MVRDILSNSHGVQGNSGFIEHRCPIFTPSCRFVPGFRLGSSVEQVIVLVALPAQAADGLGESADVKSCPHLVTRQSVSWGKG